MGQVSPKYFYPSAPYGSSDAVNALNAAQPSVQNPQAQLLPPNFTDPGTQVQGAATAGQSPQAPKPTIGTLSPQSPPLPMQGGAMPWNPQRMFGL